MSTQLDIQVTTTYARVTDDAGTNVSGALPLDRAIRRAEMLTRRGTRTYTTTPAEPPKVAGALVRRKRASR